MLFILATDAGSEGTPAQGGSEGCPGQKGSAYNDMAKKTTYAACRGIGVVRRRDAEGVALVPVDELAGLQETAQLLRSPKNARRLLTALRRAEKAEKRVGQGDTLEMNRRTVLVYP